MRPTPTLASSATPTSTYPITLSLTLSAGVLAFAALLFAVGGSRSLTLFLTLTLTPTLTPTLTLTYTKANSLALGEGVHPGRERPEQSSSYRLCYGSGSRLC